MVDSAKSPGITLLSASAVATIIILFIGWSDLRSLSWPTASGTVVHGIIRPYSTRSGPAYEVKVAYAFTVGDKSYAGSQISFGPGEGYASMEHADKRIGPYREGKMVTVHYDPSDPWQSVLEPGPTGEWEKAMTISVIGLLLGGFLLFLSRSNA